MSDEIYTESRNEDSTITVTKIENTTGYTVARRDLINGQYSSMGIHTYSELVDLKYAIDDMIQLETDRMLGNDDGQSNDSEFC